jgi:hypothetical protein
MAVACGGEPASPAAPSATGHTYTIDFDNIVVRPQ